MEEAPEMFKDAIFKPSPTLSSLEDVTSFVAAAVDFVAAVTPSLMASSLLLTLLQSLTQSYDVVLTLLSLLLLLSLSLSFSFR